MQIKYQCEKVEWKELIRREETIIFFELLNCFRRNVYSHSKLKPRLRNKGSLHSTFSLLIWTLISPLVQTDKSHLLSIIALGIFVKIVKLYCGFLPSRVRRLGVVEGCCRSSWEAVQTLPEALWPEVEMHEDWCHVCNVAEYSWQYYNMTEHHHEHRDTAAYLVTGLYSIITDTPRDNKCFVRLRDNKTDSSGHSCQLCQHCGV